MKRLPGFSCLFWFFGACLFWGGLLPSQPFGGGGSMRGGDLSTTEKRAEALRTVYRRFSEKANTSRMKLTTQATALVDLMLDLKRNQVAVARGEAPRSRIFMGPAHGVTKVVGDRLFCKAVFVNLTIAKAEISLRELPGLLKALLDPGRYQHARCEGEKKDGFNGQRLLLLARLCCRAAKPLAAGKEWNQLRTRVLDECLHGLDKDPDNDLQFRLLECLALHGDDATATTLVKRLEKLGKGQWNPLQRSYLRTVCRIPGKTGRAHLLKSLDHKSALVVVTALGAVPITADATLRKRVTAMISVEPPVGRRIFDAALGAMTRIKGKGEVQAVDKAWRKATDKDRKYSLACALTRMGSATAVPWLKEILADLQRRGDIQSIVKATVLKSILARYL